MTVLGGGGAVERIGVDVVANTGKFFKQVDGAVNKATGKFGGLAKKLGTAVKAGALVGGVAIAGLGTAAIKMGIDFEKSIAEVRTLLPDITEEGFGKLKGEVLDLSKEMGIATDELIPALYQAISAGVPPDNVIDFLRTGAKASIGGVTDLETAIDGLTTITNAWGLESDKAGEIADVMFTGVKLGKTTMGELSNSMFQAAPLASALGISVQEVVAATATLTKSGVPTSIAMTSMRQAMVAMSKPTADMTKLLEKTGFASGEALIEAKGFTGAIDVLSQAADGNKEVLAKAFGSVEALGFVLGVSGDNAEVAAADLALVTDSAGAADEAFATMDDTISRRLAKATNLIRVELTKLGIKVLPLLAKGLEKVIPFLEENLPKAFEKIELFVREARPVVEAFLKSFIEGIGVLKDAVEPLFNFIISNKTALIAAIAAIGVAILLAFGPGAVAIVAIIGLIALIGVIKDSWDSLKVVLIPVGIALGIVAGVILATMIPALIAMAVAGIAAIAPWLLLALPLIAIVAVIALVVAGIILLIKNFDKIEAALKDAVKFVTKLGGKVKDKLIGTFKSVLDWLKKNWPILLSLLAGPFFPIVAAIIFFRDDIWRAILGIVGFFTGLPGQILSALSSFGTLLLEVGQGLMQGLFDGILLAWELIKFWHTELPLLILDALGELAETLLSAGEQLIKGLFEGVMTVWKREKAFFENLPGNVLDLLSALAELLISLGEDLIRGLFNGAATVWERNKRFFSELPGKITEAVGDLAALMVDLFLEGLNALGDLERDFANAAFDLGRAVVQGIKDGIETGLFLVRGAFNSLISLFERGINYIIGKWNDLEFTVSAPFGLGSATIGTPDLPLVSIPRLRHGGPLAAGELGIVNEGDIEFFRPFSSGTVLPIEPAGRGRDGGRWTNYGKVINIHGAGRRTTDVLRDLDRQVAR